MAATPIKAIVAVALAAGAAAGGQAVIVEQHRSVAPSTREWAFEVPAFSIEHQVRLSLEARIDHPRLAGSNHWLRVAVNDTSLTEGELLNKRNEFKMRSGMDLMWVKHGRWRILYSPDFKAAVEQKDHSHACPGTEPYRFVWDITRHVEPGKNTLRIQHLKILVKPSTLVLRNVRVAVGKPIAAPEPEDVTPPPTGPLPTFVAKGPQRVPMQVALSPVGMLRVEAGGTRIEVGTRTSLPEGQWHEPQAGEAARLSAAGEAKSVTWHTPLYRIERQVALRPDHVHVADTLTNLTDQLIGVVVEHRVPWPQGKPTGARVSGKPVFGERMRQLNPAHPSVFAQWTGLGLGLVAEDDVFRVHCVSFLEPGAMGLLDDKLGIAPHGSVTLEWSLYPVPGGDYWDFINAVRRAWDTNFAIPGPFCFTPHFRGEPWDAARWGEWFRTRTIKFGCGGIVKYRTGKYAHGTGILFAPEWVAREKAWVEKVKAGAPHVIPTAYFHAQISTEPDATTKYADSKLLDAKGKHLHYPYRYPLPGFLPTLDNAYGKALPRFLDTLLDTVGVEAIYWDEMAKSVLLYTPHGPWDGHSVRIDRTTHKVVGKQTCVPLVMQPLKLELIRRIRGRVKHLFGNAQPATRTMTRQKAIRFVETGSYSAVTNTHLGCPWGLGNHHAETTHADAARNVRRILAHGAVYCPHLYNREPAAWNFLSVMYPITPVELRAGMVLGAERIHTARSGRFGWPDGAAADVTIVDAQGKRADPSMAKEIVDAGRRLYELRLPSDHFAILVRR